MMKEPKEASHSERTPTESSLIAEGEAEGLSMSRLFPPQ